MLVELQIDTDAFKTAFREQLRKALACQLSEGVFDINPQDDVPGTPYIIVGYTVGKTEIKRSTTASPVCIHIGAANVTTTRQVKKPMLFQDVVVHVCWRSDLDAANTAKAAELPLTLPLKFEMSMDTCGNQRMLCLNYLGLDGVDDALVSQLGQNISTKCIPLPVDRVLSGYLPPKVDLINAHLILLQNDVTLAVRLEFWGSDWGASTGEPARTVGEWETFYNGMAIDRLTRNGQRDGWSIFVDHLALTEYVRKTLSDSVNGKSDIIVTRQPTAAWYDWYGWPGVPANRIHGSMEVKKVNACWCFTEDIDVTADVDADVLITVPKDDTLRLDIYMKVGLDFWDASCCALTAAFFWPILGFGQAAQGKITNNQYLLGFLPFAALVGAILALGDATHDMKPPAGFQQDPDNKDHFFSEQPLDMPNDPSLGSLTLKGAEPLTDDVTLHAEGLRLYGTLQTVILPQPELQDPVLDPFRWGSGGHCSTKVAANTLLRLEPVEPGHWALLQPCDIRIVEDPLGVYILTVQRGQFTDIQIQADFYTMQLRKFWDNPYPCRLLVKTTGGVRILTFPVFANMTQDDFNQLQRELQLEFVNNCYYPRHRLFEELEWPLEVLIEEPGLNNWTVRASGMQPGEELQLVNERGQTAGRFTANRNGTLLVTALGRLEGAQPTLMLRRGLSGQTALLEPRGALSMMSDRSEMSTGSVSSETLALPDDGRGVVIRQTVLKEQGRISLAAPIDALVGDSSGLSSRMIIIVGGRGGSVLRYDLSDPARPVLESIQNVPGVRGAIVFGGELLFWGEAGIWGAADAPPRAERFAPCARQSVIGAAVARGRLFVLRGGDLRVYDQELCEIARHESRGAEQIVAAGGWIALRDREGLRVFDALAGSPDQAEYMLLRGASHLEAPPVALGCDALYARGRVGTMLLQIIPGGELERIAEYETGAWFEGVVRSGKLLAFLTPDRTAVRLVEAVRSAKTE